MHYNIRSFMGLRRDFPFEIGWHDVLTTPVDEERWRAKRLPLTLNDAYGPEKLRCYGEYLDALTRLQPDRLMVYILWRPKGAIQDRGWVQSRRFGALVEGGPLPMTAHDQSPVPRHLRTRG